MLAVDTRSSCYSRDQHRETPHLPINGRLGFVVSERLLTNILIPLTSMAYRCTGRSNDELVSNLCRHKIIHTDRVEQVRAVPPSFLLPVFAGLTDFGCQAFRRVDRRHYVIDERDAYKDAAQYVRPLMFPPA